MSSASSPFPTHFLRRRLSELYAITDDGPANENETSNHEIIVRAAIAGGINILQLRTKQLSWRNAYQCGLRIRRLTRQAGVLFIVNDRPDLALACDADGVHLGPEDMPLEVARKVLGPHRLIGISCGDPEEARQATTLGADYIGAGAIFATQTKNDAGAPIGIEGLKAIVNATSLPVAAIGGINLQNIASIRDGGASMACVVSAISRAGDAQAMTAATHALLDCWRA